MMHGANQANQQNDWGTRARGFYNSALGLFNRARAALPSANDLGQKDLSQVTMMIILAIFVSSSSLLYIAPLSDSLTAANSRPANSRPTNSTPTDSTSPYFALVIFGMIAFAATKLIWDLSRVNQAQNHYHHPALFQAMPQPRGGERCVSSSEIKGCSA